MSVVEIDVYTYRGAAAGIGTLLGTIHADEDDPQLKAFHMRVGHRGDPGALNLKMSRHHPDASLIGVDRLYKVRIPIIDSDPIAAFVSKDAVYQLTDRNEEGAEDLEIAGVGLKALLKRARLLSHVYAPGQPFRGSANLANNEWTWIGEPFGAIATRALEEGINQTGEPLHGWTLTFDRVDDSDSNPWDAVADETRFRVGTDLLEVISALEEAGDFFIDISPNLVVSAYQTSQGQDLTGSIHFEAGNQILTSLQRRVSGEPAITHLLLEDVNGAYSEEAVPGFSGVRGSWGYKKFETDDDTQLNKMAQEVIRASRTALTPLEYEITPTDFLPGPQGSTGGDFWVADTVSVSSGTGAQEIEDYPAVVTGITFHLDEAVKSDTDTHAAKSLRITVNTDVETVRGVDPKAGFGGPVAVHAHDDILCRVTVPPGDPEPSAPDLTLTWDWESDNDDASNTYTITDGRTNSPGALSGWWGHNGGTGTQMFPEAPIGPGQLLRVQGDFAKQRASTLGVSSMIVRFINTGVGLTGTQVIGIPASGSGLGVVASIDETLIAPALTDEFTITFGDNLYINDLVVTVSDEDEPASAGFLGSGHIDLVGTSRRAARCDHAHHVLREAAPTTTDDQEHGYPVGTSWIVVDDVDNPTTIFERWRLLDNANGAAVWVLDIHVAPDVGEDTLRWEAVTNGEDVFVWEDDDLVHEWKEYA